MPLDAYKNFALSTLASGINSAASSLSVQAGHGARFPAAPFNLTIYNSTDYTNAADAFHAGQAEIVRVTAKATDTFTISRGQEGTSAVNLNTAGKTYTVIQGITAKAMSEAGFSLNLCVVSYPLDTNGQNGTSMNSGAFTKVTFNTVNIDQASAWDAANNEYVVPASGQYAIYTKLRPQDGASPDSSYGQGAGVTVGDSAEFAWYLTVNGPSYKRNGSLNVRFMQLSLGDRVKMFYFADGFSTTAAASMTIFRIG